MNTRIFQRSLGRAEYQKWCQWSSRRIGCLLSCLSRFSSSGSNSGKCQPSGAVHLLLSWESSTSSCAGSKGRKKTLLIQLAVPEKPLIALWRFLETHEWGKASREEQANQGPEKHKQGRNKETLEILEVLI